MNVVGFDFGTTNSLISQVRGKEVIHYLDEERRPIPSVVCYEGGKTIAGRAAKQRLSEAGLGVKGNIVRSPKMYLGRDSVHVEGVERNPVDIVADVIGHVVQQAMTASRGRGLKTVDAAVVTIPVDMKGHQRRALRDAFNKAGVRILQFVHEPLAALYGFFKSQGTGEMLAKYDRKLVLVFDWGGGTLDLTLCRPVDGMVVQIRNDGTDLVGGDRFDDLLMAALVKRVCEKRGLGETTAINPGARAGLLEKCERAKIDLSSRPSAKVFKPTYFKDVEDEDFEYDLGQDELEQIVAPLVAQGFDRIERLLRESGFAPEQVALCVATGGMSNMPVVKRRLHEIFGPLRVHIPDGTATLIAEGAAWIASDKAGLQLAKNVELLMARHAFLPLVKAGTAMPIEGEVKRDRFDLYCVDPRDGWAKLQVCAPVKAGRDVLPNERRLPLATLTVEVDRRAKPFTDRLELHVTVTDDLVLQVRASSLEVGSFEQTEIHDLEFGLAFSSEPSGRPKRPMEAVTHDDAIGYEPGQVTFRSNVTKAGDVTKAAEKDDWRLPPGDLVHQLFKGRFDRPELTEAQRREHLYYVPCAVCGRRSSDPVCRCG